MALVRCSVMGCPFHVREGLRRPYYAKGTNGQELADGRRCWRCRGGQRAHLAHNSGSKLEDADPFHAMELRIMKQHRDTQRDAYQQKLKSMTPDEFEAHKRRTTELLARAPHRRGKVTS